MIRKKEKKHICKVDAVVDIIKRKWNLLIIWHMRDGRLRFSELQSRKCSINSKTITKHLCDLERCGILTWTVYPEVHPWMIYILTGKRLAIFPVIDAILLWGDTYLSASDETVCPAFEKE